MNNNAYHNFGSCIEREKELYSQIEELRSTIKDWQDKHIKLQEEMDGLNEELQNARDYYGA